MTATPADSERLWSCAGLNRLGIVVCTTLFLSILMSWYISSCVKDSLSVIAYNAAFVLMMDKSTSPLFNGSLEEDVDYASSSLPMADRRFSYGTLEKSLSFAGAFAGSLVGTLPFGIATRRFGAHRVMAVIGTATTILSALHPICICTSFPLFVIVRFIIGMALSNLFPVAGIVCNVWAPLDERGVFVALLSGHVELSPLFTMPAAAFIGTYVNWPMIFYIHALICAVLTALWIIYYRDQPRNHPFVSGGEFRKISLNKPPPRLVPEKPPMMRIFRSPKVWAVWIAVVGNFLCAQFTITFSPMYLTSVLGYSPAVAGYVVTAPIALLFLVKFLTGVLSDRLLCLSELAKLRLFNSLALLGSGVFFLIVCLCPPAGNVGDLILIVIPVALLGFQTGGFPKSAILISKQHAGAMIACGSMLAGSFIVPALTTNGDYDGWRRVFLLYAVVLVLCNTFFVVFAGANPSKWTSDAIQEAKLDDETAVVGNSTPPSRTASA